MSLYPKERISDVVNARGSPQQQKHGLGPVRFVDNCFLCYSVEVVAQHSNADGEMRPFDSNVSMPKLMQLFFLLICAFSTCQIKCHSSNIHNLYLGKHQFVHTNM